MTIYYSPSTGGFYDSAVHHDDGIPADRKAITASQRDALLAAQSSGKNIRPSESGMPVAVDPDPPTTAEIIAALTDAVQQHMDAAAQAAGYDSIASAVTYADEPAVPRFQAEGQALRAWRSQVWSTCYAGLDEVMAGTRAIPTAAELLAELPPFTLPE